MINKIYNSVKILIPPGAAGVDDVLRVEQLYKIGNAERTAKSGDIFLATIEIYNHLNYDYGEYYPLAMTEDYSGYVNTVKLVDEFSPEYKAYLSNRIDILPLRFYLEPPKSRCHCGAKHTSFSGLHSEWCPEYTT